MKTTSRLLLACVTVILGSQPSRCRRRPCLWSGRLSLSQCATPVPRLRAVALPASRLGATGLGAAILRRRSTRTISAPRLRAPSPVPRCLTRARPSPSRPACRRRRGAPPPTACGGCTATAGPPPVAAVPPPASPGRSPELAPGGEPPMLFPTIRPTPTASPAPRSRRPSPTGARATATRRGASRRRRSERTVSVHTHEVAATPRQSECRLKGWPAPGARSVERRLPSRKLPPRTSPLRRGSSRSAAKESSGCLNHLRHLAGIEHVSFSTLSGMEDPHVLCPQEDGGDGQGSLSFLSPPIARTQAIGEVTGRNFRDGSRLSTDRAPGAGHPFKTAFRLTWRRSHLVA